MSGISKSQVSRLCDEIDEKVQVFLARPIEGDWPSIWIDATYLKVRRGGRIVSVAVIIAVGVNADGRREGLGMEVGTSEAELIWTEFLRSLTRRGLRGVKLVISDAHLGLKAAVSKVLCATWQRCRDLPAYTREVMARAEAQPGTRLSWVAADHHDTGHAHTHIILPGRRANGQDLVIPNEIIRHGFRNIPRDVATEWLGARTRNQAREALEREVMRHAPTRLDRMIADPLPEGASICVSRLAAPDGDRAVTRVLRARAREL